MQEMIWISIIHILLAFTDLLLFAFIFLLLSICLHGTTRSCMRFRSLGGRNGHIWGCVTFPGQVSVCATALAAKAAIFITIITTVTPRLIIVLAATM